MYMPYLKLVALPVPGIIGVAEKIEQSLYTPALPFLPSFNGLLFGWTRECIGQICSPYSFSRS